MRKTILTIIGMTICLAVRSQIPNPGFENWTTVGTYQNPDGWANMNSLTAAVSVFTCEKSTLHTAGSFSVKLTTKLAGAALVPGIMTSGTINQVSFQPLTGFPYSQRPASLKGSWQFMAYGADQGFIEVTLTKWNAASHKHDTVSFTHLDLPGMVMAWAAFTMPLTYQSSATPDTGFITISSSGGHIAANSYVLIDDLQFYGTAGINEINKTSAFRVYPNPSSSALTIETDGMLNGSVEFQLVDLKGRILKEERMECLPGQKLFEFNAGNTAPGSYFLRTINDNRTSAQKVIIY